MVIPKFVKDWLQETLNRIFIKKPAYFKYWQWFSYAILGISGIPYLLVQLQTVFPNFVLGEPFATLSNKAVTYAGIVMLMMSQLTVSSPTVGRTTEGNEVKVTDEKKMPFTAKDEQQNVVESVPPPPIIEEIKDAPVEKDDN